MKKVLFVILVLVITIFSGCNIDFNKMFFDIFINTNIPENNLVIGAMRDGSIYTFSDKVRVTVFDKDDKLDYLSVNCGDNNYKTILEDNFNNLGYFNDELYIITNEKYYVFCISEYNIPEPITDGKYTSSANLNPEYDFNVYTVEEFIEKYPDYKTFSWYICEEE